jgi:hypothetical protein
MAAIHEVGIKTVTRAHNPLTPSKRRRNTSTFARRVMVGLLVALRRLFSR